MPSFEVQTTPNPNSLKITTDAGPFIDDGFASYTSIEEASDDPLARAIFRVEGIMNVLMMPQFLTVTKSPEADWDTVLPQVREALNQHFSEEAS